MKIAVLSSLAQNTGCFLRAGYLAKSLKGYSSVRYLKPLPKNLPFMLDMLLSIPINIFRVLFSNADVFIGIKPFPNVTLPLLIKKIISGSKVIIDIDDLDSGYRKGLLSKINSLIQKPFPKYFDLVTYHNSLLHDYIKKEFKVEKELYKLEQGVDLDVFNYKIKENKLRKKFSKNNEKIILFIGHLNIASDLDEIIRAMKIVQKKSGAVFIVAGGGPEENNFKKLAKEIGVKAVFTGHISKEEIVKYVSVADLCLVYYKDKPANYYRCSMKLRECMAMEKKIVCNDVGELKEFKKYCYQSGTSLEEYANKIIKTLKAGDKREIKARKLIEKRFNWNKIGEKFVKKLRGLKQ